MSRDAFVAAASGVEAQIANIWQDILELERVGADDDFFALGGDSLRAVHMLAAVDELLDAQVSFADFIDASTIAAVAELVERARLDPSGGRPVHAPVSATGEAPCTHAQERLWFLEQLGGSSSAYNMPLGVRLRGPLDIDALGRALQDIVDRHEALRTTFTNRDGHPVQVTAPSVSLEVKLVDVRDHPDSEDEAATIVDELASMALPLEHGPLVQARLIRVADDEHVLELVFHHAVCDGGSHVVVMRELGELYRAYARGEAPSLPPPRVQYPDHARRERATLDGPALQAAVEPWLERLADCPPALELPTDHPRPPAPSYRGATHRTRLEMSTAAAVRSFAKSARSTPFATLLAAYGVLLHRHSGQDDIVIGVTTSARDTPELEDGVGLFASTVALRLDLAGEPSFAELVARVREVVGWAIAHERAPFDQIVAQLPLERDLSRHPVFQVFCAHVPLVPLALDGILVEPYDARPATSRFDLTFFIEEERGEALELTWEYGTDLFDPSTVERLARQYLALLDAALADPELSIAKLPVVDERAPGAVAIATGAGAEPGAEAEASLYPVACMHERFEQRAARAPRRIALSYELESLSYGELNERANRLAHHLRALGAGPETMVALFLEPSLEMMVAILGVLKAGAAYVPLDPAYPAERTGFILADAAAPFLVTQAELLGRLPAHDASAICLDRDAGPIAARPAENPEPLATPENLAYVIYTSGSTGRPKGVQVEHRQVARLFTATDAWYGFRDTDTWSLLHSYAFDFSVWEIWGALAYGGHLVISPMWTTRSPPALAELIADHGVTVMNATPSLFAAVQDELLRVADRLALRFVVFGGEALQPAALRPWFEHFGDQGPTLVNMYGITETTVHVTYRPIRAADCARERSPIGVPIPDLTLHLLDPAGRPVTSGLPGELFVGGAGVARGYLNRPELDAERFIANPFGPGRLYRTGDVACLLADGELDFRGRIDDQVKIRGFRIELGEVRAVMREVDGVADCAVTAVQAGPGDVRLAAYVVLDPGGGASEGEIRERVVAHLGQRLPEYMVPAAIMLLDRLPLTRNGKTDRKALPPPVWESSAGEEFVAPLTPTEEVIAEMWRSVLGVASVGREDNFFSLGGHSLLAAKVTTQVRERFAVTLSVRVLFEQPTLSAFAGHVDSLRPAEAEETAVGDGVDQEPEVEDVIPLSFQQQQLLFFDALEPGNVTYNAALALRVIGELDERVLRQALAAVTRRHEALRTVFAWDEVSGRQVVLERWSVELATVDLTSVDAAEREAELDRLLRDHARGPFDLSRDVMLRATLFRLAAGEHVLLFQTHHVAFDAWAVEVFYRDLGELYAAALEGRSAELPELPLRYGDFARRQRERLQGAVLERELEFWRTQLSGAPAILELPTDKPRPPVQSFDGARYTSVLDAGLAAGVRELSQARQVTPYMVLLSAFGTLLYRRSGQDDILFGGPMANRDQPGLDDLVGFFANTIVVRTRLGGNPTFSELLARVRESVLQSYEHQEVALELVVEAVRPRRVPGVNPLFQVNFRARVGEPPVLELPGADTSLVDVDLGLARFDLALELHLLADGLAAEWGWNTALFERPTILALAADYESLLRQALVTPEARLLSFELAQAPLAPSGGDGVKPRARGVRAFRQAGGRSRR